MRANISSERSGPHALSARAGPVSSSAGGGFLALPSEGSNQFLPPARAKIVRTTSSNAIVQERKSATGFESMLFITPPSIDTPLSAEAEVQPTPAEVKAFSLDEPATLDDSWEGKMTSLLQSPKERKERQFIPNIDFQLCSTLDAAQFPQNLSTASSTNNSSSFLVYPCHNASFPSLTKDSGSAPTLWQRSNSHDISSPPLPPVKEAGPLLSPSGGSKKNKAQFNFPDGGWVCSACQNYNFYGRTTLQNLGRTKCNRCQKQKSKHDTNGKPRHLLKKEQQLGPKVYKKPLTERVGDWVCVNCRNLNFSFREMCNRCNLSRDMYGQSLGYESSKSKPAQAQAL